MGSYILMAELKAPWVDEIVSMGVLTWVIALVQILYNSWRIFVDRQLLLDMAFTRIEPNIGYVFNWDVNNIFLVARFFSNLFGVAAACVLIVGNCQRVLRKRIGLEECVTMWRSLTVCQPCVIVMELTLSVLRWDTQELVKLLSSFGIPFIFTLYFLFLVESFYREELKSCLYESLESEREEKMKIKPDKTIHSYETI